MLIKNRQGKKHLPLRSLIGLVNQNSLNKRVMALYSVAAAKISLMSMDRIPQLHSFDNDAIKLIERAKKKKKITKIIENR